MTYKHALNALLTAYPFARSVEVIEAAKNGLWDAILTAAAMNPKGWPWFRKQGYARNGGGYRDGNATFTNGSRTVTGTGTAWTSAHVGWRISPSRGGNELYTVAAVSSGTSLTLDRQFEGDTLTETGYRMYDPYCVCPADLERIISVQDESGETAPQYLDAGLARASDPKPLLGANAGEDAFLLGPPTVAAQYSTGTVTIAKGSTAVTGSGTAFPENVIGRHIRFQGEDVLYEIAARSSGTSLTLARAYGGLWAGAGRTYEIDPPGCLRLEVRNPREDSFALKLEYLAIPEHPVNDTDRLQGSEEYLDAVINLARADCLAQAIPWASVPQDQVLGWRMKMDNYRMRGERMLQALIGGNVPPERDLVIRNYARM